MNKLNKNNLDSRYTFDTFIVGNANRQSYDVCKAIAESPTGDKYNPLFIYGNPGVGKTHLMKSIVHYILHNGNMTNVLYVTSEQFVNEAIETTRNHTTDKFIEKYKKVDVLLIDDIQFVAGKEHTQELLLDILSTLYDNKKQIILSSTKLSKDIENLSTGITSLFEHEAFINIQAPDYETRMDILMNMAIRESITNVPMEVYSYIALNFTDDIRTLQGALHKICAYSKIYNEKITLESAKILIKD